MARADQQMNVRVPKDVKAWLRQQSKRNGSSLTSEIIRAIRERMERVAASSIVAQL